MFEHEHLKQNDLFSTIKRNNTSRNTITVFFNNARSFSNHIDDIVSDDRIINNEIILTINNFNKNKNNFLRLVNGCRKNVAILDKFDSNGMSIFNFRNMLLPTEHSL